MGFWKQGMACAVAVVGLCSLAAEPVHALSITLVNQGGTAPGNAMGAGSLTSIMTAAANAWENAISDAHALTITYSWAALGGGTLGVHNLVSQGGVPHRETNGNLRFDNDGTSVFFVDGTPLDNSEYTIFTNTVIGGANAGRVYSGATGLAVGRFDLYSIALHEIGHALGLSSANTAFQTENVDFDIDIESPRLFPGLVLPTQNGAHLSQSTALMYPFFGPGERKLISDYDILANAEISDFRDTSVTVVPEPGSIALFGLGVLGFGLVRRRRKTTAVAA